MKIFGAVIFEQPDRAEVAKNILESEGYGVALQNQADGSVVLTAVPLGPSSESALNARMQLLAADFGGEFLGQGGSEQYVLGGHS